jgi:hypothetical protein
MWIMRVGNLYSKSNSSWFPLYEILLERCEGARWLDEIEFEFWDILEAKISVFGGRRYLIECLKLRDSSQRMALIMEVPEDYRLGNEE